MTHEARDRIVTALSAEQSPLRDEGVELFLDHVLGRPLGELVDLHEIRDIVIEALTADNVALHVARHVKPGFERYGALTRELGETVGGLIPEKSVDDIHAIVAKSKVPRAKWAEGMIEPSLIRRLFAPVWTNLLLNFAKKMPIPGAGVGGGAAAAASSAVGRGLGGVASRLSKSVQERAEKIADAGRSVMGGLGAELEKRVQSTARDFSESAQSIWRDALKDRLKSAEGRELLGQIQRQVVEHLVVTRLSALHEDVEQVPLDDIFAAAPRILEHAVRRPFIQKLVEREIDAFLAHEGRRSLSQLMAELGILDRVRKVARERASNVFQAVATSAAFAGWVDRLLTE